MLYIPVEEVKIYRNSAVIRRKTTVELKKGINEITLFGLSRFADPDSLRLLFSEGVTGKDVKLVPYAEAVDCLPSESLNDEIGELETKYKTLKKMNELWISNGNFESRGECSIETIERYLEALPSHLEKLRAEQKEIKKQIEALTEQKKAQEIKESFQVIKVVLESPGDFEATCEIEYLDKAAQWKSSYEIHANTDSSEIEVVSRAEITQSADEDWENVSVLLCTGNPDSHQNIPTLKKLELRFKNEHPIPRPLWSEAMLSPMASSAPAMGDTTLLSPAPVKRMSMETAEETIAETMTIYRLPGRRTIPSGAQETMADIKTDAVPAELHIICIPKLDDSAYLAAVIKSGDWPLKPSRAKIYLDRNYCGEIFIAPNLAAEDTFMISLGKDERVSLDYEEGYSGTEKVHFKGQNRRYSEHVIRIRNLSVNAQKVTVWDQIPVSAESQISVDYVSADGAAIDNESGKLSWSLTVEGKSAVEKRVSYSVYYPKDKTLSEVFTSPIKGLKVCPGCGAYVEGMFCPNCGSKINDDPAAYYTNT